MEMRLAFGLLGAFNSKDQLNLYTYVFSPGLLPKDLGSPVEDATVTVSVQEGRDQNNLQPPRTLTGVTNSDGYVDWNQGKIKGMFLAQVQSVAKSGDRWIDDRPNVFVIFVK